MRLNTIYDLHKKKKPKRVGRGIGSGKGKTSGAGHKGQRARTGVAIKGFEGGQMPLTIRLPKRGFNNPNKLYYKAVNIGQLNDLVEAGKITGKNINKELLCKVGLISTVNQRVKLLAKGILTHKIEVEVDQYSVQAQRKIHELGGKVFSAQEIEIDIESDESQPNKESK